MNRFCSALLAALTLLVISAAKGVSQTSNTSTISGSSTMSKSLGTNHSASRQQKVSTDKVVPQGVTSVSESSWDWTRDALQTLYSYGTDSLKVHLPWSAVGTKTYQTPGNYPKSQIDFYRQEGWVLLYRDFGADSIPARQPLFILYNKYRGILRFFSGIHSMDFRSAII